MRLPTLLGALATSLVAAAAAALGQGAPPGAAPPPAALFAADQLRYDRDLDIVIASGNVELVQDDRILRADTVTYNRPAKTVSASGNVSLLETSGDVFFADYVELTDDFKEGVLRSLRVRLTDDSLFAATSGRRMSDGRTELNKAVYSPCKLCVEDPTRAPLWQIKAQRIVRDTEELEVRYYDAHLEMFGVPVAYTPYFVHPDPTVKRKSGLLAPRYGSDSQLGLLLEVPYFINIAPDRDATFAPIVTTNEGVVLAGEYRQRLRAGSLRMDGSVTRGTTLDGGVGTRGHFRGSSRFDLDNTWRSGLDIFRTSDDTYLKRYDIDNTDTATSHGFVEGFRGRNYAAAHSYAFQSLRADESRDDEPFVLPLMEYQFLGHPDRMGGRWSSEASLMGLTRFNGTDSRRLSLKTGWQLPYTSRFGELYTLSANLQTDGYWASDLIDPATGEIDHGAALTGRAMPQIGFDWQLPLVRSGSAGRVLVSPTAGFFVAPNTGNPRDIPNEDSQDVELDDTNLSSASRFTGVDRVDGGQRAIYGLRLGYYRPESGGNVTGFFGQSYRLRDDDTFLPGSGLDDRFSDFVGRVDLRPHPLVDMRYRFRLDKNELNLRRNELFAAVGSDALRLGADYLFIDRLATDEFNEREEVSLYLSTRLTQYWSVGGQTIRDLAENGGSLRHGARLRYEDECFVFTTSLSRDFTSDRDAGASDRIFFRLEFKHLGAVESGL